MHVSKNITPTAAAPAGLFRLVPVILLALLVASPAHPFGKNKVNRESFSWGMLRTVHFDIYYPYGMEDLAKRAARMAEEGYVHIANSLNHELTDVVPVIVYPSHIDFQETNILQMIIGEGTGGFTEAFKNRVVVPFTGSYREFRHVLTHELVHAFQYNILLRDTSGELSYGMAMGGVPLWVMEGMAEYLSAGFDETADMVMRDLLFNEKYDTLMDLTRLHVKSGYLLYKEGQAFYYFFEKKYGRNRIGEFLRDIRDSNFEEAVRTHTDKTLEELNLEWIRFYKKRYFPVVRGKDFDEEEGDQLTFHEKTQSSFNVCPAVSPDGKRIAYISNMDIYASVTIVDVDKNKKKERKIRTILTGDNTARFEGMHLLSNYLTWSRDGKRIVFVAQSYGRDVLCVIGPEDGKVLHEVRLPFRAVMDPSLSADGKIIAFTGQLKDSLDIYLYYLEKKELRRMTNDLYSDRYPKISSDNSFLVFSSNRNPEGRIDREDYYLVKMEIATGKRAMLVEKEGNSLQADLSPDDKKVLYISNRTGIYNAYCYHLDSGRDERVTNVLCGIFYPRWFPDGNRMAFVAYQNLGYDVFVKDIGAGEKAGARPARDARDTDYAPIAFPRGYFDFSRSVFDEYTVRMSPDWLFFGIGGTIGYGFAGFAQMGISDYLGDHRLIITTDYLRYQNGNDVNFDVAYYFLKYQWDYGIGIFRQKNPFGIFTLGSINDLIHNVNWDTLYMDYYGAYAVASYPFSRFFRFNIKATASRYERDYSFLSSKTDTFANLNQLSVSLSYDNVLWGPLIPLDGWRGQVEAEQSFNVTGQDFRYSSVDIDVRKYFLLNKQWVAAFRGVGGRLFGPDREFFQYYIGGFNTLRGHPLFAYGGENLFMFNAEFRFTFIEGIKFGFPLFFRLGGIGGVIFADCGSAWTGPYHFRNREGEFDDFKADLGFGFRLILYPLVILKLDYAWPYYYKSFGKKEIIFSLGFEY